MPDRNGTKKKNGTAPPPLPPDDALGFGATQRELYAQLRDILGNVAVQNSQLKSVFGTQKSAIHSAMLQGLQDVENSAIERGVLGSSADFGQRIDVRSNASTQLAEAAAARNQGLLASNAQAQQAYRNFRLGVISLMSQKNAAQAQEAAAQAWQQALGTQAPSAPVIPGGGGGGGGADPQSGDGNTNGGLTPGEKKALERDRKQLLSMIDALAGMHDPASRQQQLEDIRALWKARNRTRRDIGLDVIGWGRLAALIQKAQQDRQGPHGQT